MIQRVLRWFRRKPDTAPAKYPWPLTEKTELPTIKPFDRRWRFHYYHGGPFNCSVKTPEMQHEQAMQYMQDTVDEMRAILGKARVYGPYEWPDGWELEGAAQNKPKVKRVK